MSMTRSTLRTAVLALHFCMCIALMLLFSGLETFSLWTQKHSGIADGFRGVLMFHFCLHSSGTISSTLYNPLPPPRKRNWKCRYIRGPKCLGVSIQKTSAKAVKMVVRHLLWKLQNSLFSFGKIWTTCWHYTRVLHNVSTLYFLKKLLFMPQTLEGH